MVINSHWPDCPLRSLNCHHGPFLAERTFSEAGSTTETPSSSPFHRSYVTSPSLTSLNRPPDHSLSAHFKLCLSRF